MRKVAGNLLDLAEHGEFDIIAHGCNCFHAMRRGIAKEITERYPSAKQADLETVYGDRRKLGNFSETFIESSPGKGFRLLNAYTQYKWSGYSDVFEYGHFETFLNRLSSELSKSFLESGVKIRVGFPKIGCGLAGGDEKRILQIIDSFSKDVENFATVTLVEKDLGR